MKNIQTPHPALVRRDGSRGAADVVEGLRTHPHQGDACMFCDERIGLARTSEDPLAFRAHLDRSDECQLEYQMWKQVITDEWLGD